MSYYNKKILYVLLFELMISMKILNSFNLVDLN